MAVRHESRTIGSRGSYGLAVETRITIVARNSPIASGWCTRVGTSSTPCRRASIGGRRRPSGRAEGKAHARRAIKAFSEEFGVKWPRAVEEDHLRRGGSAALLRLSGRALAAFEDNRSDRVAFRHREGEESAHEGAGVEGCRPCDDLQAVGVSRGGGGS